MPLFSYTVTTPEGERSSGTMVAPDRAAAERYLVERELVVTRLLAVRSGPRGLFQRISGPSSCSWSTEQLMTFTEQISAMTQAGVTLKAAMNSMLKEARHPAVIEVLSQLLSGLQEGHSFTELLSQYPTLFSAQFVAMVAAGESSGHLPQALNRLTVMILRAQELRRKVMAAFYYPALILMLSFLIAMGLLVFAIPRFKEIYEGLGGQLPLLTVVFVGLGNFLTSFWWLVLILAGAAWWGIKRFLSTERGEYLRDNALLRTPVLGPLFVRLAIARFARTLGSLQASGVQLTTSLELVGDSVGNRVFADVVKQTRNAVIEGEPLVESLSSSGWFTEMAISLLAVGDESGTLDVMLERLADYYETQVDISLRGMTSLIEPAILVFVGSSLGVVILAMVLPVFKLATLLM
jgi:type II secretory pathway component PulF